jgi:hypothetical protein
MTQHSFDFSRSPDLEAQEIKKWVEKHNHQVIAAAQTPTFPPGSMLGALDAREVKANAVYMLRGILSQHLRRSLGGASSPFKREFMKALRGEIVLKNSNQDPAFIIRNHLMHLPRHPSVP